MARSWSRFGRAVCVDRWIFVWLGRRRAPSLRSRQNVTFRRGAVAIGVGNAVSKVLGIGREVLFAYALGTGPVADAFRLALSLILIPTHFVTGELSLASAVSSPQGSTSQAK